MSTPPGKPTIKDVARAAGVSVATVSRVVNGTGSVSPEAREAVGRALAATAYTASPIARSLAGGRTGLVGLCAHQPTHEYAAGLIAGMLEACETAGYGVLWFSPRRPDERRSRRPLETLPDGVIVVSPTIESEEELAWLDTRRPIVHIEPLAAATPLVERGELACVTAANHDGAADATRHLLDLGHRRIGFVTGPTARSSSVERLAGHAAALADAGLGLDPSLVVEGNYDLASGFAAGRHLLALPHPPTAIFASDDTEAIGVVWAAHEAGRHVPNDLSVIGFDDMPMAEQASPPLTTMHQPLRAMGQRAAEMLIAWIEQGERPVPNRQVLPTHLVVRASTRPLIRTEDALPELLPPSGR